MKPIRSAEEVTRAMSERLGREVTASNAPDFRMELRIKIGCNVAGLSIPAEPDDMHVEAAIMCFESLLADIHKIGEELKVAVFASLHKS